jgi:hypothetical protein
MIVMRNELYYYRAELENQQEHDDRNNMRQSRSEISVFA